MRTLIIACGVAAFAGFGSGWTANGWRLGEVVSDLEKTHKSDIDKLEIANVEELNRQLGELRNNTKRLQDAKDKAEVVAASRKIAADRANRAAHDASLRLSEAVGEGVRRSQLSHEACLANTSTLGIVFDSCGKALVDLAREADGHVIDKLRLEESFPTNKEVSNAD